MSSIIQESKFSSVIISSHLYNYSCSCKCSYSCSYSCDCGCSCSCSCRFGYSCDKSWRDRFGFVEVSYVSFWEDVIKLVILEDNISLKLASRDSLKSASFLSIIASIMSFWPLLLILSYRVVDVGIILDKCWIA